MYYNIMRASLVFICIAMFLIAPNIVTLIFAILAVLLFLIGLNFI